MDRIGFFGVVAAILLAGGMPQTGTAATPYTHQNFLNDPEEFRFAVIPDRSGGDWRGAWTNALAKVNLLRPDFVITVGDLMEGSVPADKTREQAFREQHAELAEQLKGVVPPFYSVVGNHDIHYNDPDGLSRRLWQEHWGENTYYSFLYKNVLFIAIDSMEKDGISAAQYDWMAKTLRENAGVRWTFLFLHRPDIWGTAAWKAFEQGALKDRRYTVFAGDLHTYFHVRRNGNDYYALATAGGDSASNGQNPAKVMKLNGLAYGEMDHIAWVTVAKDGPHIANLVLDGIVEADYLGIETTKATTLTSDLNDPPVPAATANAARNAARRKERFYKWSCDGFGDWKATDAASAAAWTLADGTVRFDATKGPVTLRFGKACTDFDLHYQYRLEKGSEARVVYVDDTPGDEPVEYVIADGLCRPDEWTHGRVSVTGNVITFEIGGIVSKRFTRRTENPSGHFELRGLSGKGAFRRFYGFDLRSDDPADSRPKALKVLMIGNSFSQSVLRETPAFARSAGVGLDLAQCYIGGCSLKTHWANIEKGAADPAFAPYQIHWNYASAANPTNPPLAATVGGHSNLQRMLAADRWDVVTIQQRCADSFRPETFQPYADNLIATIRRLAPQAKIYAHETWSNAAHHERLAKLGMTQDGMSAKIAETYRDFSGSRGLGLIPMGTATRLFRRRLPVDYGPSPKASDGFHGDVVGQGDDFSHLNRRGHYLQAAVWTAALFGIDPTTVAYRPDFLAEDDARLMRECARDAVARR